MKVVVFSLAATLTSGLQLRGNVTGTAEVHLATKKKVRCKKSKQSPVVDPVDPDEDKRDYREQDKACDEDHAEAEAASEIAPKWDCTKKKYSCEDNVMRCIYTHALPYDYCMVTNQEPWCKNYVDQPACLMVENYDLYVKHKGNPNTGMEKNCDERDQSAIDCELDWGNSGYTETGFTKSMGGRSNFGRWLLGGRGALFQGDHHNQVCAATRGWGKPAPGPDGMWSDYELPSCKSKEAKGSCTPHNGGGSLECPSCGAIKGQTQGATHDNDVTHGGMR